MIYFPRHFASTRKRIYLMMVLLFLFLCLFCVFIFALVVKYEFWTVVYPVDTKMEEFLCRASTPEHVRRIDVLDTDVLDRWFAPSLLERAEDASPGLQRHFVVLRGLSLAQSGKSLRIALSHAENTSLDEAGIEWALENKKLLPGILYKLLRYEASEELRVRILIGLWKLVLAEKYMDADADAAELPSDLLEELGRIHEDISNIAGFVAWSYVGDPCFRKINALVSGTVRLSKTLLEGEDVPREAAVRKRNAAVVEALEKMRKEIEDAVLLKSASFSVKRIKRSIFERVNERHGMVKMCNAVLCHVGGDKDLSKVLMEYNTLLEVFALFFLAEVREGGTLHVLVDRILSALDSELVSAAGESIEKMLVKVPFTYLDGRKGFTYEEVLCSIHNSRQRRI